MKPLVKKSLQAGGIFLSTVAISLLAVVAVYALQATQTEPETAAEPVWAYTCTTTTTRVVHVENLLGVKGVVLNGAVTQDITSTTETITHTDPDALGGRDDAKPIIS